MHFFSNQHRSVSRRCGGYTYVSVSASACGKARFASSTKNCRLFPVLVRVAALLITYHTSPVPAKYLSAPFCSISRATNRLRTSIRSSSPLLMSRYLQEISLRPVLIMHVASVTSSKVLNLSYHDISSARALATSSRKLHPSPRPRSLLRNRSRTHHIGRGHRTRPIHTPCPSSPPGSNGRLPACIVCTSPSLSAALLEAPPVISDYRGATSS